MKVLTYNKLKQILSNHCHNNLCDLFIYKFYVCNITVYVYVIDFINVYLLENLL